MMPEALGVRREVADLAAFNLTALSTIFRTASVADDDCLLGEMTRERRAASQVRIPDAEIRPGIC
jgi:hypothetical protein